ncbi:hypothetical protein AVEN_236505-1 [Araneus ventricosus]|uniref:Uncharacterized protein n=1 Tax=Araneus ventricosus TaxID=182803 RepID=A0A4Y2WYQ7_ARAVE|nr:hypothetical protein AVEN_236505-1 [Araneus ventricosus]
MHQKAIQDNCSTHSIAYWPSQQTSDFSTHVDKRASQKASSICITAQTLDPRTMEKRLLFQMSLVFYCIGSMGAVVFAERHQETNFQKPLLGANKVEETV